MRSGVGAACPFTFFVLFLLEPFELPVCVDFPPDDKLVVCVVLELLLCTGFFDCVEDVLCAATADTLNVPTVRAARSKPPRLRLRSNSLILG